MLLVSDAHSLCLVVEGPDDELLIKDHCSDDLVVIAATGGREQVLRTAAISTSRGFGRVKFLVDKDFDDFFGAAERPINNVVESDTHDCFMDVVYHEPRILYRVVEVEAAPVSRKMRASNAPAVPEAGTMLREAAEVSLMLSSLRIISGRRELGLDFKKFPFGRVPFYGVSQIAEVLFQRSRYSGRDRVEIVEEAERLYRELRSEPMSIIGDHDYFAALAAVMRKYGASIKDSQLQRSFLAATLFACPGLNKTGWFGEVQSWAANYGLRGFTCDEDIAVAV